MSDKICSLRLEFDCPSSLLLTPLFLAWSMKTDVKFRNLWMQQNDWNYIRSNSEHQIVYPMKPSMNHCYDSYTDSPSMQTTNVSRETLGQVDNRWVEDSVVSKSCITRCSRWFSCVQGRWGLIRSGNFAPVRFQNNTSNCAAVLVGRSHERCKVSQCEAPQPQLAKYSRYNNPGRRSHK